MSFLNPTPSIPKFRGPYKVGSTEYEIPISEIDQTSKPPSSKITTIKFRLFYPTDAKPSRETITWVPPPQKQWIDAFSNFLGASLGWSSVINPLLSILNFITIPAIPDTPLHPRRHDQMYPLAIFSHGLAGNCNTYSSLCGSLASCGVICAALEHRDGSSPMSSVRSSDGKPSATIKYRKYSHSPTAEVFNARNAQLRIRLWELDLLYAALLKLDNGDQLSNYAHPKTSSHPLALKKAMDFRPGHVSWVGHSFGAATVTQFVKSIYYQNSLPSLRGTSHEHDQDWRPLYSPSSNEDILSQITPSSPVALLDVWTLPFQAHSTQWLWGKPLPCYDRQSDSGGEQPSTVSIMSTEFYNWEGLRNKTRALLSQKPVDAMRQIEKDKATSPRIPPRIQETPASPRISTPPYKGAEESLTMADKDVPEPETDLLPPPSLSPDSASDAGSDISRNPSPASASILSAQENKDSAASSQTNLSIHSQTPALKPTSKTGVPPRLFYIPNSAHLSQSDFGLLFPRLVRVLMKAIDPEFIMTLNVRAVTQVMRNAGLDVRLIDEDERKKQRVKEKRGWAFWRTVDVEGDEDGMLGERDCLLEEGEEDQVRWKRLALVG